MHQTSIKPASNPGRFTHLAALAEATGKSRRELKYRAQFAEAYPTDDEVGNALPTFTSWYQVTQNRPKAARAQRKTATKPPMPHKQSHHSARESYSASITSSAVVMRCPVLVEVGGTRRRCAWPRRWRSNAVRLLSSSDQRR